MRLLILTDLDLRSRSWRLQIWHESLGFLLETPYSYASQELAKNAGTNWIVDQIKYV